MKNIILLTAAIVPLTNYPKHLKIVVYNYVTDLLGTASIMVY